MGLLEKTWFKWVAISSIISASFAIFSFFFLAELVDQKEAEALRAQRQAEVREYEDRFRSTMVRVYQNLRFGHFLAAYKNIDEFSPPLASQAIMHREYYDALSRIAVGLLENDFLDESEGIFQELQQLPEHEETARESLVKIASARRYASALRFLDTGIQFVEEKRYRDAVTELRKAKLEFDSVELYNLQDTSEETSRLAKFTRIARYHLHLQEALRRIEEAGRLLESKRFADTQKEMADAASHVGRAAFYSSLYDPEVERFRNMLIDLKTELAYQVPNAMPIYNLFDKSRLEALPTHFYLKSAEINFDPKSPQRLDLRLDSAIRTQDEEFFVLRYKAYFFNGKVFFNGTYIDQTLEGLEFQDELPEDLKGQAIKRVDLSVYDQNNILVSRHTRAYRRP